MILRNFPIPPTSNNLYIPVRGRLIKSKEGREYDLKVQQYGSLHFYKLKEIREKIKEFPELLVETVFVFHKSRVIGKQGQMKKLDSSNRIKQVHDGFAKLIGIDDCYYVQTPVSKATCDKIEDEQVIITISKGELKRFEDM